MDGGLGHGNSNNFSGQSAMETLIEDEKRDNFVKKHNIKIIRIDCKKSDLHYIKNNIFNSKLIELFDLSKIDWNKIEIFALSSRVKEACDLWNKGMKNTKKISNIMKMCRSTIIKYLTKGGKDKLNWCDYDPKQSWKKYTHLRKKYIRTTIGYTKPVVQLSLKGKFIKEFTGVIEAEKQIKIKHIYDCCNKKRNQSGGYIWLYKTDYIKYQNINNNGKIIIQLSFDGQFIKEWNSIIEAEKELNINNIILCCENLCNYIDNYKWIYKSNYDKNNNYDNRSHIKKKIVQLDLNNNFIKEYNSIAEAEKETNILNQNITKCCKGKRNHAGKFKWMYKSDYEKYIEDKNNIA